jgi:hypothetical protein
MGMAAQAMGHSVGTGGEIQATEWLRRSERHLELVGAAQDARSIRVLLDVQLALAGDPEAERRLHETAASGQAEEVDTAQASLGLAQLAWQRKNYDEALGHADAVIRAVAEPTSPAPPPRIMFLVAAAVLHLRVAEARATPGAEARAVDILTHARQEVLSANDSPLLGGWALGGAELAAFRGDDTGARELWALGIRAGANVSRLFPQGHGERLTACLGDEQDREPLLAASRGRPIAATNARLRELMGALLRPSSGTPGAPAA